MDKETNKVPYITGFLREFATIFTLTVLSMSLTGKLITGFFPEVQKISSIFALGDVGLPYNAILQIAGFALVMAYFSRFLFSECIMAKLSFIWRYILFFLATLITTSIFSIVFKWFPVNNLQAWLVFLPAIFIGFAIAIGLSYLVLKLEDKKYNRLLKNYKSSYKK